MCEICGHDCFESKLKRGLTPDEYRNSCSPAVPADFNYKENDEIICRHLAHREQQAYENLWHDIQTGENPDNVEGYRKAKEMIDNIRR